MIADFFLRDSDNLPEPPYVTKWRGSIKMTLKKQTGESP